jgi:hypothetical protein
MLRDVRREVERRYYDSTFKGIDLGAAYDTADARIRAASAIDEALAAALSLAGKSVDPARAAALLR